MGPKISVVIPTYNRAPLLRRAVESALAQTCPPDEIIVVDDASTDATTTIARQQRAQVIRVEHRQIAATRNAGARQAHGEILFFVDADTLVDAPAIQSALRSIKAGAVGGGCFPHFEGWLPWWWRLSMPVMERLCRWLNIFPSGACLFCTRSAFQRAGGFNENYYAAEEVAQAIDDYFYEDEEKITEG